MLLKRIALTVLLVVGFCPAPASAQTPESAQDRELSELQPGDMLKVTVFRRDELSGEFLVGSDSTLVHPLYKGIRVAGVPYAEAEQKVRNVLLRYETNPEFVLEPRYTVYVGGAVGKAGMYHFGPETTLVRAVAAAGGSLNPRHLQRVRLVRDGRGRVLNLRAQTGGPIHSGDQIFVEGNLASYILRDFVAPASSMITSVLFLYQLVAGR